MRLAKSRHAALNKLAPFQRAVLLACAEIPCGQVRTYSQLARAIGKPNAARAVANALAKNPLAPIIPCHRVIRSDGKIGGYSGMGGIARKEALLGKERADIRTSSGQGGKARKKRLLEKERARSGITARKRRA